jgi:Rnl2 family RNA ligase
VEIILEENEQKLLEIFHSFISENRLRNVISKVGQIAQKDFGKLMGFFSKDIDEEFMKDNKEEFEALDKVKRTKIKRMIMKDASDVIRSNFTDIIDGEF